MIVVDLYGCIPHLNTQIRRGQGVDPVLG